MHMWRVLCRLLGGVGLLVGWSSAVVTARDHNTRDRRVTASVFSDVCVTFWRESFGVGSAYVMCR